MVRINVEALRVLVAHAEHGDMPQSTVDASIMILKRSLKEFDDNYRKRVVPAKPPALAPPQQ